MQSGDKGKFCIVVAFLLFTIYSVSASPTTYCLQCTAYILGYGKES